jgi:penicillin-binding protein 2B
MKLADMEDIKLVTKGDGFVASQSPAAGQPLKSGSVLTVQLQAEQTNDQAHAGTSSSVQQQNNP